MNKKSTLTQGGKHDGAFLSSELHKYYIAGKFAFNNLRAVRTDLPPQHYCFAVAKGDRVLLHKLDLGLVILKSTGKYQEIYDKWFGVYEKRKNGGRPSSSLYWHWHSSRRYFP